MSVSPIIVSTWSFGQRGNHAGWPILEGGGSALDAVVAACSAVERDPEVDSVGFGGLPDSSGEVSLDASVMLSPSRCGSVCAVRGFVDVAALARAVMERTPHVLLAGDGAERFAESIGMTRSQLVSPEAKHAWERWMENPSLGTPDHSRDSGLAALRPVDAGTASGRLFRVDPTSAEDRWKNLHDTIGTLAIDAHGVMAGACSTSGMAFKLPGRVGDSPIIGAGLYVDPDIGAATATGTGELVMGVCGSFLIVELMRLGESPHDAIEQALRRIERTFELQPRDQVAFMALSKGGGVASGALRAGFRVAVRSPETDEIRRPDLVLRRD